jgi:hypothetical protein
MTPTFTGSVISVNSLIFAINAPAPQNTAWPQLARRFAHDTGKWPDKAMKTGTNTV